MSKVRLAAKIRHSGEATTPGKRAGHTLSLRHNLAFALQLQKKSTEINGSRKFQWGMI
jgi:hypothetical protein